jgi:hypothetical protein
MNNINNNQSNKDQIKHHHHNSKKANHIEKTQYHNNSENVPSNFQSIKKSPRKSPKHKLITRVVSEDFKIPPPPLISNLIENEKFIHNSSEDEELEFLTLPYQFNITNE